MNPKPKDLINYFTVDLEDWYQAVTSLNARSEDWPDFEQRVVQNTHHLLRLMQAYGVRATFFVLGQVALDHPDLIRKIAAQGHELAVHGHKHRNIQGLAPQEFKAELERALATIRPLIDQPILGHRAPYFSINKRSLWALDALREAGFRYDSSFFPSRNLLYGFPDAPRFPHRTANGLLEFPLSTLRRGGINWPLAGGFYFRITPYALVRAGIRRLNRQGHPAILYLHPWELDVNHRYNQVTPREWIVQYTNRAGLERKLQRLFADFHFRPLRDGLVAHETSGLL